MFVKPRPLSRAQLDPHLLEEDKKACKKYGPCGLGQRAIYLNTFYLDRRLYLPYACVKRVYKRLAMSKGGFTGKGMFATIPYLVVEYDDGNGHQEERQFNFKFEQNIDLLLGELASIQPQIKRVSAKAEKRLAEKEKAAAEAARLRPELDEAGKALVRQLSHAQTYLEEQPGFAEQMTAAAQAKRICDRTHPQYKWVALAALLGGFAALAFGIWSLMTDRKGGAYFLLIGMAAVLFFSSAQMRPTGRSNQKRVAQELEAVLTRARELTEAYPGQFPLPARYAHPVVLERMRRIVEEGRAHTLEEALEVLKTDLKALNAQVQVEQWEYDEVVAIKPLFLLADYQ